MGDDLRGWLGDQIRWRVVGSGAEQRREELFESDEPGWFDDDAPIRDSRPARRGAVPMRGDFSALAARV